MTILTSNIKRIFRDKSSILIMIVFPVIFISAILIFMTSGEDNVSVGVLDNDETEFTTIVKNSLKENFSVEELTDDNVRMKVLNNQIDYGLVFEKGFTKEL